MNIELYNKAKAIVDNIISLETYLRAWSNIEIISEDLYSTTIPLEIKDEVTAFIKATVENKIKELQNSFESL